jgi:hypothetical protein
MGIGIIAHLKDIRSSSLLPAGSKCTRTSLPVRFAIAVMM